MDEKKYKSIVVVWGVILLILQALSVINVVGLRPDMYDDLTKLVTAFVATVMMVLIIVYIVLSLKKKKAGPIIGIITGAIYILNFSVVSIIAGICFIIYCAGMLKELGKE